MDKLAQAVKDGLCTVSEENAYGTMATSVVSRRFFVVVQKL